MSLQVCHCGWKSHTTYQGLRTHQGKMGCTPKGMRIQQVEKFRFEDWFTVKGPQIKENFLITSINSDTDSSDKSWQVCHCGWTKYTSYQGLRIHQGEMGCTPKGMRIPESEQDIWGNQWGHSHQMYSSSPVEKENVSLDIVNQTLPTVMEVIKTLVDNQQPSVQMDEKKTHRALEFTTSSQPVFIPVSQTLTDTIKSAAPVVPVKETNTSFFETPQRSHQTTAKVSQTRRALDFSTGAQQVEQLVFKPPTTTAQETVKDEERQKERNKKKEAEKLLKARQDRMRAELQWKIQIREHKLDEVISSVKACKGSLDAEWLEINTVFSEVMKVVEEARQKALHPLEERRRSIKRRAQNLVQKLEKEIDKLKKTIDEFDNNPDLQVCPPTGLDDSRDWTNVSADTSFSIGTLTTTTSAMMEQIKNKLENLSAVELKRIPTFAVDVKLDPATAHQCLDISNEGKEVRDGGMNLKVPDAPGRFDMFGSILAQNSLTSGKSYWEVEVSNKTGWDLGVARGSANRKGKLSLNPDNGYWVIVHYESKQYAALTAPPVSLPLKEKPQKVGVFVDYEEGLISFYDVKAQSHIYSFTECSFSGEIFPYFSPHLKQNGKNSHPLIICPVKNQ
ncbi:E3 ubiquitin-protein ligase TRIM21-like isoform X2 [Channa argus]|uniref:E3 ubiquitin-protein ligase TRIM21-like isoform X2 n=1 Tax=Channa argus TaxID=215402 RepID=UPI0035218900